MNDVIAGNNGNSAKSFEAFYESLFPFTAKDKDEEDRKLKEAMKREVTKGPLFFSPVTRQPLRQAATNFKLPDDFRVKLQQKARAKAKP